MFLSLFLLEGTKIYNADGELVPGTSHMLLVDATVQYLNREHLPFAIAAFLILVFTFLPPLLLIFYPCKIFQRCLNCCSDRKQHALRTFVEAFQGSYKTGGWDFRPMSGVYLLLRFAIFLVSVVHNLCWILHALLFLSTSLFILIVQPYKKHYMDVLDALLLALLGFLVLLVVTLKFVLPSANETLPLIFVVACGVPQLALLLSVTYRQLKGKKVVQYIAGRVSTLLNRIHKRNQVEDELSDGDQLPHRLICPNQYDRSLPSKPEQMSANCEMPVRRQVPPVYNYGSVS